MARKALIEIILILAISVVTIIEGLRLTLYKDPSILYDPLGPGIYTLFLGIALLAVDIFYIAAHYRKGLIGKKTAEGQGMNKKVPGIVVVCATYLILIEIVGYMLASLAFFLIMFTVVGIKSLRKKIILTLSVTAAYYFTFVYYGGIIFPRGIVFN